MQHAPDPRLATLRGPVPAKAHNARTIAALTKNPACTRRAVIDAAGIDKEPLARRIGFEANFGQSRFALARGNTFEAMVKRDGCAELLRLLRTALDLDLDEATYTDLETVDGQIDQQARNATASAALGRSGESTDQVPALFDHPLLRFDVAGQPVYLEPDLVAFQHQGVFTVVEIKSFPVIDGQADGTAVAAAAIQSAVYVLALRQLLGRGDEAVSHEVVLVCPENFANRPVAVRLDVRKQLIVLRHQLARLARVETMVESLPDGLTLDLGLDPDGRPTRPAAELVEALGQLPARYCPDCLAHCDLSFFCRDEARGTTAALGTNVIESLGGVPTVAEALAVAGGNTDATSLDATSLDETSLDETEALLRTLARLYAETAPQRPPAHPHSPAQQSPPAHQRPDVPAGVGA